MHRRWRAVGFAALIAAGSLSGGAGASAAEGEGGPTLDELRDEMRASFGRQAPDASTFAEAAAKIATPPRGSGDGISAAALPPGLCYGSGFGDTNETNDSLLDANGYAIGFDCESSTWLFDVTTLDNWSDVDLGWVNLMIDSDRNVNTGCEGIDHWYEAWYDEYGTQFYFSVRTPNCDTATDLGDVVGLARPAANQVTMVIPTSRFQGVSSFRWQSSITHWDLYDPIDWLPNGFLSTGQYRTSPGNPCGGRCFFLKDSLTGGPADVYFRDAQPATEILYGDWNGDGVDSMGYRNGTSFVLKNAHAATGPDHSFLYGRATDKVYVGDWDGNGTDTLAVRRGATYYFSNELGSPAADHIVTYGRSTDTVLVGDWDGDGIDTLAVRRGATYYIKNTIGGGAADSVVTYGRATDAVLVGDWDGTGGEAGTAGDDTLAVRRGATYYIKNAIAGGAADTVVTYGRATDITFTGDWDADGVDTLGVRR